MEQFCQDKIKIAIVGAGPAGVYCALQLGKCFNEIDFNNYQVYIFDKAQALRTLLPTGNGRCNITNSIIDIKEFCSNYPRGEKFLYSVFHHYFSFEALEYFKEIGVDTYIQDDGRIFPKSNSSKDVKDKLLQELKKYKNIKLVNKNIETCKDLKQFDKIIISAGSRGSENLIKSFNHTCIPFKKALCELKINNFNYPTGVSVKSLDGDFIFTQDGISGPLAFKISSLNVDKKFPYEISIKLINFDDLYEMIQNNSKKSIGNILSSFVPRSLAKNIAFDFDKKASEISKDNLRNMCNLKLNVVGVANKGEIVNAGGVDLDELDKNFKSKIMDNLWFCGEVVNIDGFCGGFNLQNCWSGGYVVAKDVIRSIIK